MSQENTITPPPVMWAQNKGQLFVTFCLEDLKHPTVNVEPDKIYFRGVGGTMKKDHEVTINLLKEIDPEKTTLNPKGRLYEVVATKKESGPYWSRLTKENNKFHWLKCDFNKWKDEEDSDSESESFDFEKNLRALSNLGDNESAFTKPNFSDMDKFNEYLKSDSDDEGMPDLE